MAPHRAAFVNIELMLIIAAIGLAAAIIVPILARGALARTDGSCVTALVAASLGRADPGTCRHSGQTPAWSADEPSATLACPLKDDTPLPTRPTFVRLPNGGVRLEQELSQPGETKLFPRVTADGERIHRGGVAWADLLVSLLIGIPLAAGLAGLIKDAFSSARRERDLRPACAGTGCALLLLAPIALAVFTSARAATVTIEPTGALVVQPTLLGFKVGQSQRYERVHAMIPIRNWLGAVVEDSAGALRYVTLVRADGDALGSLATLTGIAPITSPIDAGKPARGD